MSVANPAVGSSGAIQWRRSIAWLAVLAPFFFLSYGYSNRLAAENGVTDRASTCL